MYKADFSTYDIDNGKFNYFNFINSILVESICECTNFSFSNFWKAHFDNACCVSTHFVNTFFNDTHFDNADLSYSFFNEARYITSEQLSKAASLRDIQNLNPKIEKELKNSNPKLFEDPN